MMRSASTAVAVTKSQRPIPKTIVLAGDSLTQLQIGIGAPTATSALGTIATFGTLVGGSGYTPASGTATYNNVPLVGGITTGVTALNACGTNATANITVTNGVVTACVLNSPGQTYGIGDSLTALAANIGGTGSGFNVPVATISGPFSTTIKVSQAAGAIAYPGQQCTISNCNQIEFNGCWIVISNPDPSNMLVNLNVAATVSAPTGGVSLGLSTTLQNDGWWNYCNGLKLRVLHNGGLSGDTSIAGLKSNFVGLYSRLQQDVFAYSPDCATVLIGTNDILEYTANGAGATSIAQNIQLICNTILAQGITVVLITTPPFAPGYTGFTTPISEMLIEIRRQTMAYVNATQNIYLIDTWQFLADPTSTTGAGLANLYLADGIHQGGAGASLIGAALKSLFTSLGVQQIELPSTQLDSYAINNLSTNAINNPLMQGSGGTAGTNTSGTIPASWHSGTGGGGSQAIVSSTVARTVAADGDTCGNNWVNVFTSAANGDNFTINSNVAYSSQFVAGQWLQFEADFGWSGATNMKYVEIITVLTVGGVLYKSYWMGAADQVNPASSFRGRIKCAPLQVPPALFGSITAMSVQVTGSFSGAGGVTTTLGRAALRVYPTLAATTSN
jgi:lysophospholipase L1-like esterase